MNTFVPSYCSEVFCGGNGDVLKENEILKFPKLAQTYRTIAEEGADAFYLGEVARNLVADIQSAGNDKRVLVRRVQKMSPIIGPGIKPTQAND